jgi:hypothetical protein
MAGFYTALIGTSPTIQWPGLSPPCTLEKGSLETASSVEMPPVSNAPLNEPAPREGVLDWRGMWGFEIAI